MTLKAGDKAPDFTGLNQDGQSVSLNDFKGKKLILYFYPKDDTPGCTAESCSLRDRWPELKSKGFKILGVSMDNQVKHQKFISKYGLPFPLIADTEKKIIESFGVWGRKKFMGREYDGILRTTFIIDENAVISHIIDKVKTKNHSEQILELITK
ncbi:MAG: thioredoxin-dependent thiol peroxidase [Vicingaceae bacterium]